MTTNKLCCLVDPSYICRACNLYECAPCFKARIDWSDEVFKKAGEEARAKCFHFTGGVPVTQCKITGKKVAGRGWPGVEVFELV